MRSPIRRSNNTSKHKQKGVVAIEFAIGFMAFWLMCMMWVEMSYMSYVSAICDVTIAQAARVVKKANIDTKPIPEPAPDSDPSTDSGTGTSNGNGDGIDTDTEADKIKKAYLSLFQTAVESSGSLWGNLIDENKFKVSVRHLSSVNELLETEAPCIPEDNQKSKLCGEPYNSPIAIYRMTYNFNPTLTFFLDEDTVFTREVIVVQEYERAEFEI